MAASGPIILIWVAIAVTSAVIVVAVGWVAYEVIRGMREPVLLRRIGGEDDDMIELQVV